MQRTCLYVLNKKRDLRRHEAVSDKACKVIVEKGALLRSCFPDTVVTWPMDMEKRVEDSITVTREVSDMSWGRLQICEAAVSQKLLPYNIIAILNNLKLKLYNIL